MQGRKFMRMVLASNNAGKLAELQNMFSSLHVQLVRQSELNISEAPEPYKTFVENALTKARHASEQSGLAAVADDAGLCIDAFGGLPGVDTAFYCTQFGYEKSDANNVKAVLEQMASLENRRAAMVSTLVAVRSAFDPEPLIAVGRVVVEIARTPMGENGFGFDPILYLPAFGKTFAQMPEDVKNANSHRGRSSQAMVVLMRERWDLWDL
jgi:XTP/dITP diphosphohydrolase